MKLTDNERRSDVTRSCLLLISVACPVQHASIGSLREKSVCMCIR